MKMIAYIVLLLATFPLAATVAFSSETEKATTINRDAADLLRQGKLVEAISRWELIPTTDRSAEMLNNLGYAYYLRSRQYFNGSYGEESFFNKDYQKAKTHLLESQRMAPERWTTYLNLGDLFFAYGELPEAAKQYESLLRLNPKYKYADRIQAKKGLIQRETALAIKKHFKYLIAEVNPSLPLRIFRLNAAKDEYGSYYDSIDVLIGEDGEVKQTLDCDMIDGGSIYVADLNFDGYYDLLALSFKGSGHNYGYCNWVFDKNSGKFKPNTASGFGNEDIELVAPYLDHMKKTIRTTWSDSDRSSTNYYRYINGKPVVMQNVTVEFLVDKKEQTTTYRRTVKKRKNGKMVTESMKVFSEPKEALSHIWD